MDSHSYTNNYNPNGRPNPSMSGPHSQGGNGSSYPPPGHAPFSTHGPSQNRPPPHGDGTGRSYPPSGYTPSPAHGSSQSRPPPGDDTGRSNPPPGYPPSPAQGPSQSHPPFPDGAGRYYPPRYPGPSPSPPSQSHPPPPGPAPSQGTPPPPRNGTGQHSGALSSRGFRHRVSSSLSAIQYAMWENVEVNINAHRWVAGIIVGFAYIADQITGSRYWVRTESGGRQTTGQFSYDQMRPCQPRD